MVTEPSPGTYRFKGSTKTEVSSWGDLRSMAHVDAGTYTMEATVFPIAPNDWSFNPSVEIIPDGEIERRDAFTPTVGFGPKTLPAGTLYCNIFINTTGEVDKTCTPRLYKID